MLALARELDGISRSCHILVSLTRHAWTLVCGCSRANLLELGKPSREHACSQTQVRGVLQLPGTRKPRQRQRARMQPRTVTRALRCGGQPWPPQRSAKLDVCDVQQLPGTLKPRQLQCARLERTSSSSTRMRVCVEAGRCYAAAAPRILELGNPAESLRAAKHTFVACSSCRVRASRGSYNSHA